MRILQIAHGLPPSRVAGVEVYTDEISAGLAERHEVAVLHAEMAPRERDLRVRRGRRRGYAVYALANHQRLTRFEQTYRHPGIDRRINEVIDEFRPDVAHIQHLLDLSIDCVDELRRRAIPIVMTLHDHWLVCANGGQRFHPELGRCEQLEASRCGDCTAHMSGVGLFARGATRRRLARRRVAAGDAIAAPGTATRGLRRLVRRAASGSVGRQTKRIEERWAAMRELASKVDRFLAPSRYLAEEAVGYGVPAEKLCCSDYGFATRRFARRASLPERARRFGFIGSLVPHKGVHVLLEAFEAMPAHAELAVCGSPADDPGYAALLRERATHPGVVFVGGLSPDRVPGFLQRIDCLVAPSIWHENSPLCIHEAFLCGVPVVASRVGGHAELLDSGGGRLYEAGDAGALGEVLGELCERPGALRELAVKIPVVKSMDLHLRELETLYEELCTRVSQGAR